MNRNFSCWQEIISRVQQDFILRPLFYFIFFVSSSNLSNYADDNTLCISGYNLEELREVSFNVLNKITELFL